MSYTVSSHIRRFDKLVGIRNRLPGTFYVRAQTAGGFDRTVEVMADPLARIVQILDAADNLAAGIDVTITATFGGKQPLTFVVNNNDGQLAQRISDWLDNKCREFRDGLLN